MCYSKITQVKLLLSSQVTLIPPTYSVDKKKIELVKVGLDRTGHMSFLTGQDRTPKFAGQVLPDRTKSGLTFLKILGVIDNLLLH